MLECVVNISEGRRPDVIEAIAAAGEPDLLDLHTDGHHHRAVLTLVGAEAPRRVAAEAVGRLDLGGHDGVHPRFGVVDVVPFVPLAGAGLDDALAARDAFAQWAATTLELPCFIYGPERSLPDVRRGAFSLFTPDFGPRIPHPTAGACAVGARTFLVAYNVVLAVPDLALARRVAAAVRGPAVRALGLAVGDRVQVSMNLIAPLEVGPAVAFDAVCALAPVAGAELVGLLPEAALAAVPVERWAELDLAADRTIESRISALR